MDTQAKKQLEMTACKVRMGVIEETFQAKSGHPGGSQIAFRHGSPDIPLF